MLKSLLGSYMKALESEVLLTALEIQDAILGPTVDFNPRKPADSPSELEHEFSAAGPLTLSMRDQLHASHGISNSSWFFHSPLQYWSCSAARISADKDLITTINESANQHTSVGVTLRHSNVFSGKRFEDHRLVGADGLVITLIHMLDSPMGRQWERNAQDLALKTHTRWRLYPADGRSHVSTLYEFRFQPLSFQDNWFLGVLYASMTLYFIYSLSRLRALKSKFGLVCAVVAQIGVSIMSSFTICAIFKIDLSRIPREAYPVVMLTVGLENIFRLINAVIMTPSESSSAARMGDALGQTGYVALAGVTQNLAILWILSGVVSSSVTAFCTFAAIAMTFDFFYLLTFFVAVLSIDVRRLELSDSLTRASTTSSRHPPTNFHAKKNWVEALRHGEIAISTRVAGTLVMVSFILIAQWHFFDNESFYDTSLRAFRLLRRSPLGSEQAAEAFRSVGVNQARTPTAWLRMQAHETAREVIRIVKPGAHSYLARVHDPLVFVIEGADRTSTKFGVRPFLPAVYDFARHQSAPFLVVILLTVAGVSLLMNYLLWDENLPEEVDDRPDDQPLLAVKTLDNGHALDVVVLTASNDGIVASVGLDRRIRVWDVRRSGQNYLLHDPDSTIDPFPVLAMTIDSDSNWLAILSTRMVALWNIPERRWGATMDIDVKGRHPASFFFGHSQTELIDPVIIVRYNGMMTEMYVESKEVNELRICRSPLVCVSPHIEKAATPISSPPPLRIITSSRSGCVHVASKLETGWISEEIPCGSGGIDEDVLFVLPLPVLSSFLAVHKFSVDLIDIFTRHVTHTFQTKPMIPSTLRCFHSTRRRPQCGSVGLAHFALAYTSLEGGQCIMQMYLPEQDSNTICFRDPSTPGSKTCCLWKETVEHIYEVDNPGQWNALQIPYLVGVRKYAAPVSQEPVHQSGLVSGLRRRGGFGQPVLDINRKVDDSDLWEVWSLSMHGEQSTVALNPNLRGKSQLLIGSLGPVERVGKRRLAVGLGNVVKIITVGNERFDADDSAIDDSAFVGTTPSRRKKVSFARRKS